MKTGEFSQPLVTSPVPDPPGIAACQESPSPLMGLPLGSETSPEFTLCAGDSVIIPVPLISAQAHGAASLFLFVTPESRAASSTLQIQLL